MKGGGLLQTSLPGSRAPEPVQAAVKSPPHACVVFNPLAAPRVGECIFVAKLVINFALGDTYPSKLNLVTKFFIVTVLIGTYLSKLNLVTGPFIIIELFGTYFEKLNLVTTLLPTKCSTVRSSSIVNSLVRTSCSLVWILQGWAWFQCFYNDAE